MYNKKDRNKTLWTTEKRRVSCYLQTGDIGPEIGGNNIEWSFK